MVGRIMESIKFRGLYRGKWKYFGIGYNLSYIELETLGQFTTMLDKNNKQIYSGDICIVQVWFGSIYTNCNLPIIFRDGIFGYELYEGSGDYAIIPLSGEEEIIGNIYENPELLKRD